MQTTWRNHMKITASLVLLSVTLLMMIAAIVAGNLLGRVNASFTYSSKGKVAIMADKYDATVLAQPIDTAESYVVGRGIINNSYSNP